jgi:tRNA-modifying protein YgfZ
VSNDNDLGLIYLPNGNPSMDAFAIQPTVIRIEGRDRVKWLHSFVTNEIRQLSSGQWTETFATDSKGKCFSHGCVFMDESSLLFISVFAGQATRLIELWDRYIINEDVALADVSTELNWMFIDTSRVANDTSFKHTLIGFAIPEPFALVGTNQSISANKLDLDARRIAAEANFPWFGIDFTTDNLPQEANRNSQAISFKKGCYLGQETIARLDALGQVQKQVFRVELDRVSDRSLPVEIFTQQSTDSQPQLVGTLTSAYPRPDQNTAIGFATLKRKYFKATESFALADGTFLRIVN